jgi:hypothetical protein
MNLGGFSMSTRLLLFLLWLAPYFILVVGVFSFVPLHYAFLRNIDAYLRDITGIYAPYLTPIVAFWFSKDIISKNFDQDRTSAAIVLFISGAFNLIIILIFGSIFFSPPGKDVIEVAIKTMGTTATVLAFITGPAIGYFFSKSGDSRRPQAPRPKKNQKKTTRGEISEIPDTAA